jgi:hypothetical protein
MVKLCCKADGRGRGEREGGRKSGFKNTLLDKDLGITHVITNHPKTHV